MELIARKNRVSHSQGRKQKEATSDDRREAEAAAAGEQTAVDLCSGYHVVCILNRVIFITLRNKIGKCRTAFAIMQGKYGAPH